MGSLSQLTLSSLDPELRFIVWGLIIVHVAVLVRTLHMHPIPRLAHLSTTLRATQGFWCISLFRPPKPHLKSQ
jgi:hypothetical protein